MSEERLQKILARAGVASRRKVEELIREARVTINGRAAEIGDKADLERDAVKVDGRRITAPHGHRYLLLNKPRGVMSTVADPGGRTTVIDLVPQALRKALVPVGRLDFLTEGLLLLTDDGEFAQRVAHPRYGCVKTYEVKVKGFPPEADLERLRAGIVLDGRRTFPCRIVPRTTGRRSVESENSWWRVELSEGRTRQIRDMFQRIGHPVQKLRRVAIGPVSDAGLVVGALRELTPREVEALLRRSNPAAADSKRPEHADRPERPPAAARTLKPRPAAAKPAARPAASRAGAGRPSSRPVGVKPTSRAVGAKPTSRTGAGKPVSRAGAAKTASRAGAGKPTSRAGAGKPASRTAGAKPISRTDRAKPASRPGARPPSGRGGAGKPSPRGGAGGKSGARRPTSSRRKP